MWDYQYSTKHSHIFLTSIWKYPRMFLGILSIQQNIVMDQLQLTSYNEFRITIVQCIHFGTMLSWKLFNTPHRCPIKCAFEFIHCVVMSPKKFTTTFLFKCERLKMVDVNVTNIDSVCNCSWWYMTRITLYE